MDAPRGVMPPSPPARALGRLLRRAPLQMPTRLAGGTGTTGSAWHRTPRSCCAWPRTTGLADAATWSGAWP
eukprot:801561-Alexandrium_andersonii.AAC.1